MRLRTILSLPFLIFAGFLQASACCGQQPTCPTISHISLQRGSFEPRTGVRFDLQPFVATLVPMGKRMPGCLSHWTVVSHGVITVSNDSLTELFSQKLSSGQSKIRNLKITNEQDRVKLAGDVTELIPLKFSITGPVTTNGTDLMVDAKSIKAEGIPIRHLLGLVGQHLSSVLGMQNMNGISVEENMLRFSPEKIAHLKGYIESAETTPQGLVLHYGRKPAKATPHVVAGGL